MDNNSTDNTVALACDTWALLGNRAPLRIISEEQQGQMFARISGFKNALYDFVCYCDDDNWLNPDYLNQVAKIFSSNQDIGIVGGCPSPVFNSAAPDWFDQYKHAYACSKPFSKSGVLSLGQTVYGAGMAIRKHLLTKIFDESFPMLVSGRTGLALSSGDDNEICLRAAMLGWKIWFDESLIFQHFVPAHRLRLEFAEGLLKNLPSQMMLLNLYLVAIKTDYLNRFQRLYSLVYNFIKWSYGTIASKKKMKTWGGDHCFFLCKGLLWQSNERLIVYRFFKAYQGSGNIAAIYENVLV